MDVGVRKERHWDPGNETNLVAALESFWSCQKTQKPRTYPPAPRPPGKVINPLLTFLNLIVSR